MGAERRPKKAKMKSDGYLYLLILRTNGGRDAAQCASEEPFRNATLHIGFEVGMSEMEER